MSRTQIAIINMKTTDEIETKNGKCPLCGMYLLRLKEKTFNDKHAYPFKTVEEYHKYRDSHILPPNMPMHMENGKRVPRPVCCLCGSTDFNRMKDDSEEAL